MKHAVWFQTKNNCSSIKYLFVFRLSLFLPFVNKVTFLFYFRAGRHVWVIIAVKRDKRLSKKNTVEW